MMAVVPLLAASLGCSNWLMENSYVLSGRTMDLGLPTQSFGLQTLPAGGTLSSLVKPVSTARYGSVGAIPLANSPWGKNVHGFTGGLNERGLSCDVQTLTSSEMGPASNTSKDVYVLYFCEFVLATFADTKTLGAALRNGSVHVWGDASTSGSGGFHHSVRDAAGLSLVVEYVGGGMQVLA
jgi:penicillin V acylase-like amidase (Ntn superfamily)